MASTTLWMIAYDISDNKKRRQVFKELHNHGVRVQYSVFECQLKKQQFQNLRQTLQKIMEATDTIRYYPLCQYCASNINWQGNGEPVEAEGYHLL